MSVNTVEMTLEDYAKWRGCSMSNVTKNIRANNLSLLPHVISIKRNGRFYLLELESKVFAIPYDKRAINGVFDKFGSEWVNLYTNGTSVRAIAKLFSCTGQTVKRYLKLHGVNIFRGKSRFGSEEDGYNTLVVKNDNGCWGWSGSVMNKGYGTFIVKGKSILAHRASYRVHTGGCDGKFVCHTCDNPICTNPEHLFLGTQVENMTDCIEKGRHGRAKLKINQVIEIKNLLKDGLRNQEIASQYGVVRKSISRIRSGTAWSHITI